MPVQAIYTTAKHLRPLGEAARAASHDGFNCGLREGRRDASLSGRMTCVLGHNAATVLLGQYTHVRADELLPGRAPLTFRSGCETVSFQNIAHGLVTDSVSKIRQGTDNTIVPPGPILSGQAHHQGFQLHTDCRAPWRPAFLRAVELLGNQLPVLGENGLRGDEGGHFRQCLLSKLLGSATQVMLAGRICFVTL
jgi:hypothetical protein